VHGRRGAPLSYDIVDSSATRRRRFEPTVALHWRNRHERVRYQVRHRASLGDRGDDRRDSPDGSPAPLGDHEPSTVDLVELARELTREQDRSARDHSIELRASETTLRGEWDPRRLGQVIDNLLGNAIKYSPRGSTILVEIDFAWAGPCEWAVLRVIDEGVGIPADEHDRVFEWFARARNVEGRIRWTGIGLAGAKQIVEQHGGSIGVESQEGAGSIFTVRLPTRADRADTGHRPRSPGSLPSHEVSDHPSNP
jgi:signal transduction histidine kinase